MRNRSKLLEGFKKPCFVCGNKERVRDIIVNIGDYNPKRVWLCPVHYKKMELVE